ncbi:hypothetical protein DOO78_18970 [Roseicella frigidaeris]|uniref:Uncharacterized protein n=2 Tax=Roseicella frigidaeris TaxID=2230885 RepID=A0A327M507_9PROT|nr:hypothetical protein DOO78_18970 [Roseicella frigidaeris]
MLTLPSAAASPGTAADPAKDRGPASLLDIRSGQDARRAAVEAQFGALFDATGNRAQGVEAIAGEVAAKQATTGGGAFAVSIEIPGGGLVTLAMSPGEMRRLMRGDLPDDFGGTVNGQSVVGLVKRAMEAAAGKDGLAAMAGEDELGSALVRQLRDLQKKGEEDAAEDTATASGTGGIDHARLSLGDGTRVTLVWFPAAKDQGTATQAASNGTATDQPGAASTGGRLDRIA